MPIWTANDMPRLDGRRVLVTGGASGIGFQTARVLAAKGARVLIAGRDAGKGQQALHDLRHLVPDGDLTFGHVDLANLQSIADFADALLQRNESIDLLMNVAGVMAIPTRTLTADGFEMHMGTNHLGHFALTGRLLPLLKRGGGRVVTVTALVARWAKLDTSDLQMEKSYAPMGAYGASKLANMMFAAELHRRAARFGVSSVAVDPGTAHTSLDRHASPLVRRFAGWIIDAIGYPLDRVADTLAFAATVAKPDGDSFVGPTTWVQSRGSPGLIKLPVRASDADVCRQLWRRSEELTGVRYDLPETGESIVHSRPMPASGHIFVL